MGNCLVTKLKQSINSSDLEVFGKITYKVSTVANPTTSTQVAPKFNLTEGQITLTIIGDGHFTDSTFTDDLGKTQIVSAGLTRYLSNGDYLVVVDKYDTRITEQLPLPLGDIGCYVVNIADYKYLTNLTSLNYGERNTRTKGNISELGNLHNLTSLMGRHNPNVTGSIEGLVEAMWDGGNGRTSGNLVVNVHSGGVTFKGASYSERLRLEFGANSVAVKVDNTEGTLWATYDGTWTYTRNVSSIDGE